MKSRKKQNGAVQNLAKHVHRKSCRFWVDIIYTNWQDMTKRASTGPVYGGDLRKGQAYLFMSGRAFDEEEANKAGALNKLLRKELERNGGDLRPVTAAISTNSVGFPVSRRPQTISAWGGIAGMCN